MLMDSCNFERDDGGKLGRVLDSCSSQTSGEVFLFLVPLSSARPFIDSSESVKGDSNVNMSARRGGRVNEKRRMREAFDRLLVVGG
jgi:hypothetical protein